MPISFLNDPNLSDLISSRPTGFKFPVGLTLYTNLVVDYLVVAGGGGGGTNRGGGGGAGGFRTGSAFAVTAGTPYTVTVGGGGNGAIFTPSITDATVGSGSVFSSITSAGGGRGGSFNGTTTGGNGSSGGGQAVTVRVLLVELETIL
jgi:hypothetical protein